MIKQAMADGGLAMVAAFGLVLFVAVFLGVCCWVATRRRQEVAQWSSLPLADGYNPVEPRGREASNPFAVINASHEASHEAGGGRGCGKCENCDC